jgi:Flp pilus assembly protein TadD
MISTTKHLAYVRGYLALDLLAEARDELALIAIADHETAPVLSAHIELAMARSAWARVIALTAKTTSLAPGLERPWIAWAYALREKQRVAEARDVLLRGERAITGPSPLVDYNLACYFCLLNDLAEARRRLKRACSREPEWKSEAATDPDLAALKTTG